MKKYSTERLKDELANTQLVIVGEQIEKLSRAQIIAHVTQIRFQSKTMNVCKTIYNDFDPSKSLMANLDLGDTGLDSGGGDTDTLSVSTPTIHSIQPDLNFSQEPPLWLKYFFTSQAEEKAERDRRELILLESLKAMHR